MPDCTSKPLLGSAAYTTRILARFCTHADATCYVGNLDDRVTDALLWELFVQAGPLGTPDERDIVLLTAPALTLTAPDPPS